MATALQILTSSFFDCGIVAAGEPLSAAQAQDALVRLNNMVKGWRTQYGTVYAVDRYIFPLTDNKQTYTIGLGGDFNVPRPQTIESAGLLLNGLDSAASVTSITRVGYTATVTQTSHGLSVGDEVLIIGATQILYNGLQTVATVPTVDTYTYTLEGTPISPATGTITARALAYQPLEISRTIITDQAQWAIQIKTLSNAQFTVVYYNPTFPFGTVFLWPLPNTTENQLVLYLQSVFSGFDGLTTNYEFPDIPGYAEALQYNLDLRLFTPYGVKDPSIIQPIAEMANQTLGLIKRGNNRLTDLPTDAQVLAWNRRSAYNINTGTGGGGGY